MINITIFSIVKASIKIAVSGKFTEDQLKILKRVVVVLEQHKLSVRLVMTEKKHKSCLRKVI
jgi:hypothetical protein